MKVQIGLTTYSSDGGLGRKVGKSDFPKKIFEQGIKATQPIS